MSSNRRIPFGYQMRNGQVEIHSKEAVVVRRIYSEYIGGAVMKAIAEQLAHEQVEYIPGEFSWNKNRVKRILEDIRYTGKDPFKRIIAPEIQEMANNLKADRNTQKEPLVTAEKKRLTRTVLCGVCGSRMKHKTDRRLKNAEIWSCSCGMVIKQTIEAIEQEIIKQFNAVIAAPELCGSNAHECYEPSLEVRRMENEISRQMELPKADKDTVIGLILQCAAQKYDECRDCRHITERLKADFEKRSPLSVFSAELYETVAEATILFPDETVGVRLRNQTLLRKEVENHAGHDVHAEKGGPGDTGRSQESA